MTDVPQQILRFVSRLQRLEALPRTGWLVSGITSAESVAAHSYEVTVIAMWIADALEEPVEVEQVLRIALVHDLGESLTSDIPRPVKSLMGAEEFARAEGRALDIVLENAPPRWRIAANDYEEADTLEARIVKAADRIQMLSRALAYEASGRGDLRRFWDGPHPDYGIALAREIIDALVAMRATGTWFPADFD